jgi:hypothetical protein
MTSNHIESCPRDQIAISTQGDFICALALIRDNAIQGGLRGCGGDDVYLDF